MNEARVLFQSLTIGTEQCILFKAGIIIEEFA